MANPIISFRNVAKIFPATKRRAETRAVDGVTFDIEQGEVFAVIGYSGAGKSTLVRLINGLEKPTSGQVIVDGIDISTMSEGKLRAVRQEIGMVFQSFNLLQSRTVAGNVSYPLEVAGWPRAKRKERVAELLDYVGLSNLSGAYPNQLSGGQRQRVGIARALATNPKILLADEATSALDPETTQDVLRLLRQINRDLGITVVVITHSMSVVRFLCDRVAVMDHGVVAELGDVYTVFGAPQAEITRRFVGTALADRPSAEVLERLRERHPGRLVTLNIREGATKQFAHIFSAHGVDADVVFGGITEVGARPVGALTFELTGSPVMVDAAVAELLALTDGEDHGQVTGDFNGEGQVQ
jgi:D-methionine transport system ATP-binding protein